MAERIKKETKRESTTEAETEENVTIVYERIKITRTTCVVGCGASNLDENSMEASRLEPTELKNIVCTIFRYVDAKTPADDKIRYPYDILMSCDGRVKDLFYSTHAMMGEDWDEPLPQNSLEAATVLLCSRMKFNTTSRIERINHGDYGSCDLRSKLVLSEEGILNARRNCHGKGVDEICEMIQSTCGGEDEGQKSEDGNVEPRNDLEMVPEA